MSKIFMGITKENERLYLTKHTWDCGWYWGMGYIGNNELHMHFDLVFLKGSYNVSNYFSNTKITQDDWWVLIDLFIQAYTLKRTAEVYKHGGRQTNKAGVTDIIKNELMANQLNVDLEKILDTIWKIMTKISKRK